MERARLRKGALLALRTGRGAWHAEAMGADEVDAGQADAEFRSVLFWVNLARKDKHAQPSAQVVQSEQIPCGGRATRRSMCWWARALPYGWERPLILDIELAAGGTATTIVPPEFLGFAYVVEGEATFGAAADLGQWDRAALEAVVSGPRPRTPAEPTRRKISDGANLHTPGPNS